MFFPGRMLEHTLVGQEFLRQVLSLMMNLIMMMIMMMTMETKMMTSHMDNRTGELDERDIQLDVLEPPTWKTRPKHTTGVEEERVSFEL